jgi:hypothetical protein
MKADGVARPSTTHRANRLSPAPGFQGAGCGAPGEAEHQASFTRLPNFQPSSVHSASKNNKDVPEAHLRAFRMAKEEILYAWLSFVGKVIEHHFLYAGRSIDNAKLFQYPFPEQLWINLGIFYRQSCAPKTVDRSARVFDNFWGKADLQFLAIDLRER